MCIPSTASRSILEERAGSAEAGTGPDRGAVEIYQLPVENRPYSIGRAWILKHNCVHRTHSHRHVSFTAARWYRGVRSILGYPSSPAVDVRGHLGVGLTALCRWVLELAGGVGCQGVVRRPIMECAAAVTRVRS